MDTFFQKLRDIQKKERATGTLSEIEDSFYDDASGYLQSLLKVVDDNPLSLEAYQLRDAQRITIEICERREVKIISTAITNVQKSHDIFKGHKKDSQLYDVIPYNVTPEEEKLYKDVVSTIIAHREDLMAEIIPNKNRETKIGFKPNTVSDEIKKDFTKTKEPAVTHTSGEGVKESSKPAPPKLDEKQIAMMYGQAPDDILLDENNQPIKKVKPKTDITTPFKPPEVPVEDTITLQNIPEKEDTTEEVTASDKSQEKVDDDKTAEDTEIKDVADYNTEELVEFKEEINTDILDENEKTYGPFESRDIVLLPESIVRILNHKNVINIIK